MIYQFDSKINELLRFISPKQNVHDKIKELAFAIHSAFDAVCSVKDDLLWYSHPGTIGKDTQNTLSLSRWTAVKNADHDTTYAQQPQKGNAFFAML